MYDTETTTDSLVDLIQTDIAPVTTVAESKKNKVVRQDNLATLALKLSGFTAEEIVNYPISTIIELNKQNKRITETYYAQIDALRAAAND